VALIEIDRPQAHNTLDRADQYHFDDLLAAAVADPGVRCLVLAGAGGKALSAGWDIREMQSLTAAANADLLAEREEWLWRWHTCPLATVAAVQGIAYGAGALLAACADLRVAGPGTRFKVTAPSYGYPALSWLLADLLGASRAKDVLFTGRVLDGRDGADVGLFNRLMPDGEVREAALALAGQVAALPPGGVQDAKRLMREGAGRDTRTRYDAENALTRDALDGWTAAELFSGLRSGRGNLGGRMGRGQGSGRAGFAVPADHRARRWRVRRHVGNGAVQEAADRVGEEFLSRPGVGPQRLGQRGLGVRVDVGEHLPRRSRALGRMRERRAQGQRVQTVDDQEPPVRRHADLGQYLDADLVVADQQVAGHELEQNRRGVAVVKHGPAEGDADPHEPVDPGGAGGRVGQPGLEHDGPRHRAQDVGPVLEVVIQRRCLDVQLPGQPGQAERIESLAVDDVQRCVDHGVVTDQRTRGTRHEFIMSRCAGCIG
jgi:enoyl-CoA hydratase/carnithine racemase